MSKYTGKTVRVEAPAQQIADKFADLSKLNDFKDKIPEDQLKKLGDLRFEKDAIVIANPAFGEMKFRIVEHTTQRILMKAEGMLPLQIEVKLAADGAQTDVTTIVDIELPAMLKPLIGGKMQQVADMFSEVIAKIAQFS